MTDLGVSGPKGPDINSLSKAYSGRCGPPESCEPRARLRAESAKKQASDLHFYRGRGGKGLTNRGSPLPDCLSAGPGKKTQGSTPNPIELASPITHKPEQEDTQCSKELASSGISTVATAESPSRAALAAARTAGRTGPPTNPRTVRSTAVADGRIFVSGYFVRSRSVRSRDARRNRPRQTTSLASQTAASPSSAQISEGCAARAINAARAARARQPANVGESHEPGPERRARCRARLRACTSRALATPGSSRTPSRLRHPGGSLRQPLHHASRHPSQAHVPTTPPPTVAPPSRVNSRNSGALRSGSATTRSTAAPFDSAVSSPVASSARHTPSRLFGPLRSVEDFRHVRSSARSPADSALDSDPPAVGPAPEPDGSPPFSGLSLNTLRQETPDIFVRVLFCPSISSRVNGVFRLSQTCTSVHLLLNSQACSTSASSPGGGRTTTSRPSHAARKTITSALARLQDGGWVGA